MKGFVPVEIPTKKYIKAYIIAQLGPMPIMSTKGSTIGHKLHDLLEHNTNEEKTKFRSKHYTEKIKIYIPLSKFRHRGANLNETNVKNFNLFVELELKTRFHSLMDDLIEVLPNFDANLSEVRKRVGIDIESWSDDSMKKSYYRYRKYSGKGFYLDKYSTRTFAESVP